MSEIEYQEERGLSFSSPEAREAAAAVAAAFQETAGDAEEQPVAAMPVVPAPSQPTQTQTDTDPETAAEPEPFDFTQFEPNLSPDLEELLQDDQPDFDAEARAEIAQQAQLAEDAGEYIDYTTDVDTTAERLADKKHIQFLEQRLVETNRGKWVQEQMRAYPLLAQFAPDKIKSIQATSRRAFAREAAKVNADAMQFAKPLLDHLKERIAVDKQAETVIARQSVQAAWGVPLVEPAGGGATAELQARHAAARKAGDLSEVIRARIEAGGSPL